MTLIETEDEELDLAAPETRAAGRWNTVGVPGERSKDFRRALRRLSHMLGRNWIVLGFVAFVAVVSATANVFGPKVLGHATDIIISGVSGGQGVDFGELHEVLLEALALYAVS
ncbi:MAG TPA: hypothetical protein VFX21_15145, partial [Acidimicrobiia bacterium]|nr:hypothetical protein [Acidimicrobiia bacterium]